MKRVMLVGAAITGIVVTVILTAWRLRVNSMARGSSIASRPPWQTVMRVTAERGDRICLPEIVRAASPRSLVVVTSSTCPACEQSVDFIIHLSERARSMGWNVFYVLPKGDDVDRAKALFRTGSAPVVRRALPVVGLSRTPTVAVVDRTARITALRIGRVLPDEEREAIDQISNEVTPDQFVVNRIDSSRLRAWTASGGAVQIIDVQLRERHDPTRGGSIVTQWIPLNELYVRAPFELERDRPVVVDCTGTSDFACEDAVLTLQRNGFHSVFALDLPRFGGTCGP